jgi:GTP-binding protein
MGVDIVRKKLDSWFSELEPAQEGDGEETAE